MQAMDRFEKIEKKADGKTRGDIEFLKNKPFDRHRQAVDYGPGSRTLRPCRTARL